MSRLTELARTPLVAIDFANILLTQGDAAVGVSPKGVVWTYRKTTLYRYRNPHRLHDLPILVLALINRPDILDLRPGNSFVEYLLDEGYDVFLVDWGVPGDEDADMGLDSYVCDELPWAIRETLRTSGARVVHRRGAHRDVRRARARRTRPQPRPADHSGRHARSIYGRWVARESFDAEWVAEVLPSVPGGGINIANKMMKPVQSFRTTYRQLWDNVVAGKSRREAITAGADHIAPREGTLPLLDLVASRDVTHFDRRGGHIGLMAGSRAREEIWPDIAEWLATRSAA